MLTSKQGPFVYLVSRMEAGAASPVIAVKLKLSSFQTAFQCSSNAAGKNCNQATTGSRSWAFTRDWREDFPGGAGSHHCQYNSGEHVLSPPQRASPLDVTVGTWGPLFCWLWAGRLTGQVFVLCQTGHTRANRGYEDCGGAPSRGGVGDKEIIVLPLKPVQLQHKQDLCMAGTSVCCHLLVILMRQNVLIYFPIMRRVYIHMYSLRLVLNISWLQGITYLLSAVSSSLNANTKALRFSLHRP